MRFSFLRIGINIHQFQLLGELSAWVGMVDFAYFRYYSRAIGGDLHQFHSLGAADRLGRRISFGVETVSSAAPPHLAGLRRTGAISGICLGGWVAAFRTSTTTAPRTP